MKDVRELLVPSWQRATLTELDQVVDYGRGDVVSKRGSFVLMIVLAAVIAAAGVVADSTATVIGAMIIAPLATPIHGVALGMVTVRGRLFSTSLAWLAGGGLAVVLIGYVVSFTIADPTALQSNSEVVGRTSPGLVDLLAALATGLAGAWALCRRDLGSVLPGAAIAISLVPPLAVVGICLGQGLYSLSTGAFLLFLSNVLAMLAAGNVVYRVAGYAREQARGGAGSRRAYLILATLLVLIAVPLAFNTWQVKLTGDARAGAEQWLGDVDGAQVTSVDWRGLSLIIAATAPRGERPDLADLRADLTDQGVPASVDVSVTLTAGRALDVP